MIAKVQYNDLKGTSAADVSDFYNNSLQSYLKATFESYDSERYRCDGCTIYMGDCSDKVNINFVCYDNQEEKYVYFTPIKEYSLKDMVNMFKRFKIVVGNRIDGVEISNDDWLDLE
jgi:hypothetical protein